MTKCPSCGLVNFPEALVCRRCGTTLVATGAPWGSPEPHLGYGPPAFDAQAQGSWQPGSTFNTGTVYGATPEVHYGVPYASYAATPVLASRGARLGATIIDSVCFGGVMLLAVVLGFLGGQDFGIVGILLGIVLALAVGITQLVLLTSRGQTIGKRMLGIRIIKLETGENGGFVTNVLMRGIVPALIGGVPYVGAIFSLVNILFIFREDYRCIHDHIAGTIVVAE